LASQWTLDPSSRFLQFLQFLGLTGSSLRFQDGTITRFLFQRRFRANSGEDINHPGPITFVTKSIVLLISICSHEPVHDLATNRKSIVLLIEMHSDAEMLQPVRGTFS
jgi:hypothetical protein